MTDNTTAQSAQSHRPHKTKCLNGIIKQYSCDKSLDTVSI